MTGPVLRKARPGDIPQIEALLLAEHLPPYGLADFLETFFVLEDGDRLLGCAGLELYGQAALLRSVAVTPAARGGRLGRRLTEAALAEASERGAARVYLFTMHASAFFGRAGFREIGLDDFEEPVRQSMQYQVVSRVPEMRAQVRAMRRELGQG